MTLRSAPDPHAAVAVRSLEPADRAILSVENLSVEFATGGRWTRVVDRVTFSVRRGEVLGLVGESGSGKTVSALAVMGLVARPTGRIVAGARLTFDGELLELSQGLADARLASLRGKRLSMIFQDPVRSLNPAFSVGEQIAAVVRRHTGASRREAWRRAVEVLESAHIANAERRAREHPHQFSGGMCQRVMIAMAIACEPKLIIADEPTTALDVSVQDQILRLLEEIKGRTGVAMIFITHDLALIARMCNQIAVMYAGQVVEQGRAEEIFDHPAHPYTEALLHSLPDIHELGTKFDAIPGQVPSPGRWPSGCRFHPRCRFVEQQRCTSGDPQLVPFRDSVSRCVRASELSLRGVSSD